jgi:hypothetical protein
MGCSRRIWRGRKDAFFLSGRKKPVFVVNKALNSGRRIFLEFYRKRRNCGIAILNDFQRLRKV